MGIISWVDGKQPAFLTFGECSDVLNKLVEDGILTYEDWCALEYFSNPAQKKANRAIRRYLKNLELTAPGEYLERFVSIRCDGDEARDNLWRFLDAVGDKYGAGFIPCGSSFDVRFPCGMQFWFVVLRGFWHKKKVAEFYINANNVHYFCGGITRFDVVFADGSVFRGNNGLFSFIAGAKENEENRQA